MILKPLHLVNKTSFLINFTNKTKNFNNIYYQTVNIY